MSYTISRVELRQKMTHLSMGTRRAGSMDWLRDDEVEGVLSDGRREDMTGKRKKMNGIVTGIQILYA